MHFCYVTLFSSIKHKETVLNLIYNHRLDILVSSKGKQ